MRLGHVLPLRLANHHLASPRTRTPAELVAHLGAVQSQDYAAAKWALGVRMRDATEADLDAAFDRGEILRTHVLRPTWHLVAPQDIRWLQQLTGPRVKATIESFSRRLGLDDALLARSEAVLARALEGGHSLTLVELGAALRGAGIEIDDSVAFGNILQAAELDGLICSGPRRGRQHTYMLLDERVAPTPSRSPEEALAELTWRYFSSHGPALVSDCTWWSSLPAREINRGLELNRHRLESEQLEGRLYWFAPSGETPAAPEGTAHLLPNYDEYTVAYRERDLYYDARRNSTGNSRTDVPFTNVILLDGQVAGRWRRQPGRKALEHTWTIEPSRAEREALSTAEQRYLRFFV